MDDRQRFDLLNTLIKKMNSGKTATEREMRQALTVDEWLHYETKKYEPKVPKMPERIKVRFKKYKALIDRADRRLNVAENSRRARGGRTRNRPAGCISPWALAESDYESAGEILEELLSIEPGAVTWLDRPVSLFSLSDSPIRDPENAPRLVTDRSPYALQNSEPKQSNRSLRFSTLLDSRCGLMEQPQFNSLENIQATGVNLVSYGETNQGDSQPAESNGLNLDHFYRFVDSKFDFLGNGSPFDEK